MYDHLKVLYDEQLWSSLAALGGIFVNANLQSTGGAEGGAATVVASSSKANKSSMYLMVAEAFYETGQHRKAESLYKEVLAAKKHMGKTKGTGHESDLPFSMLTEADLKWKLYLCHKAQGRSSAALATLQSIPARHRPAKAHLALARLYEVAGMKRSAIACYKEVLKTCPMAMEVAMRLMQLGVKAREVQELTLEATGDCDWMDQWRVAYSQFASRDYANSAANLSNLESQPMLRNEISILVLLGKSLYYKGDYAGALETLQRAHKLDPTSLSGMDVLAALLARERRHKELESLATKTLTLSESAPESWIAMGYYCFLNKKGSRAVYFGHKACMLDHKSVEALLLKGVVLLDLKKVTDAMNHFREGVNIAPNRYELNKGLVDCYLALDRQREAISVAATACKQVNNSGPRELTLFATVLSKDPNQPSWSKAKGLLEKALLVDPGYLPAVYLLVDVLEQEMNVDRAIALLQQKLKHHSTAQLHHMLADLLAKTHEEEKAMEHYTHAVNLDPKNESALKGLQKIEQATDAPLEVTYDLEMGEGNSEGEGGHGGAGELDESETGAVWSDGDLNLAASNTSSRYL